MAELTLKDVLEGMADFENRISLLEGLHTPSDASLRDPDEDIPGVNDTRGRFYLTEYASKEDVDKLKALFVNLRNQFNSHTDKKRTNKYTIN